MVPMSAPQFTSDPRSLPSAIGAASTPVHGPAPVEFQDVELRLCPHTDALASLVGPISNGNEQPAAYDAGAQKAQVLAIGAPSLPLLRQAANQLLLQNGAAASLQLQLQLQQPSTPTQYALPRDLVSRLADQQPSSQARNGSYAQLACVQVSEPSSHKRPAESEASHDGGYDVVIMPCASLAVLKTPVSSQILQPSQSPVTPVPAAAAAAIAGSGPDHKATAAIAAGSQHAFKRRKLAGPTPASTPITSANQATKWLQEMARVPKVSDLESAVQQPADGKSSHESHVRQLIQIKCGLKMALKAGRVDGVIALLQVLAHMELSPSLLAASQVGTVISKLRKHADTRVASKARDLLTSWRELLSNHLLASPLLKNARAGARAAATGTAPLRPPAARTPLASDARPSGAAAPTPATASAGATAAGAGTVARTSSKEAAAVNGGAAAQGAVRTASGPAATKAAPQKGALWTPPEIQIYLQVLREHGRHTAMLQAALPHRSVSSLRNFYQTQRAKLGLDELLTSHGHSTKPISSKSGSTILQQLKPATAPMSGAAARQQALRCSGAMSEGQTTSELQTEEPVSSTGQLQRLDSHAAQAGHMHGLGLMHASSLLAESKGGKVRPRPPAPPRAPTPSQQDQPPVSTYNLADSQLGSTGYGGGWQDTQMLQDETPSQGTGGLNMGMGFGSAGQSTGGMTSTFGLANGLSNGGGYLEEEEEDVLLMPNDGTGPDGMPSPRMNPYSEPLVGGSGLLGARNSMPLTIMDATW